MKRLFVFMVLMICFGSIFGLTWTKEYTMDIFGDLDGHYVVKSEVLSGSYRNEFNETGVLLWNVIISDEGYVYFDVHEDGENKGITITSNGPRSASSGDELDVLIKVGNEVFQFYGIVQKDDNYIYDRIALYEVFTTNGKHYSSKSNVLLSTMRKNYDLWFFFLDNTQMKIVVNGSWGSYSLGSLNTEDLGKTLFGDTFRNDLLTDGVYEGSTEEARDYNDIEREQMISSKLELLYSMLTDGLFHDALLVLDEIKVLAAPFDELDEYISQLYYYLKFAAKEYSIGDYGPALGYIFYDCDADNDKGNPDGLKSNECGWRYLEAAPSVVFMDENGKPCIDVNHFYSVNTPAFAFGFNLNEDGSNVFVNNSLEYSSYNCTKTEFGTGKQNTELILDSMKINRDNIERTDSSRGTKIWNMGEYTAAELCDLLSYSVTWSEVTFDDWFLPSKDELILLMTNLKNAILPFGRYWSSSEDSSNPDRIWIVNCPYYNSYDDNACWEEDRFTSCYVRPIRAF